MPPAPQAKMVFTPPIIDKLPSEVMHEICGYLFCDHNPGARVRYDPLQNLAAVSKKMKDEVESFCEFTILHKLPTKVTKYNPQTRVMKGRRLKPGMFTKALLSFKKRYCMWCGKATSRSSVFVSSHCACLVCEHSNFKMIHWRKAKKDYKLTYEVMFGLEKGFGLPLVRYGFEAGSRERTLWRDDVEKLAAAVQEDPYAAHAAAEKAKAYKEMLKRRAAKRKVTIERKNREKSLAEKRNNEDKSLVEAIRSHSLWIGWRYPSFSQTVRHAEE